MSRTLRMHAFGRALALARVLLFPALVASAGFARAASEYEVKAAFLFNFAKFIEWPAASFASPSSPIVLGIVGEDPYGGVLPDMVRREPVKGRRVEIRRYRAGEDLSACHILYVSRSEASHAKELIQTVGSRPVLTVGDTAEFTTLGGIINFVLVDQTVRFEINTRALENAGLKASSKLLAVARHTKS